MEISGYFRRKRGNAFQIIFQIGSHFFPEKLRSKISIYEQTKMVQNQNGNFSLVLLFFWHSVHRPLAHKSAGNSKTQKFLCPWFVRDFQMDPKASSNPSIVEQLKRLLDPIQNEEQRKQILQWSIKILAEKETSTTDEFSVTEQIYSKSNLRNM
jgi:hypothetical protein